MFLYSYQQNDPESDRVHGAEADKEEGRASWGPSGRLALRANHSRPSRVSL